MKDYNEMAADVFRRRNEYKLIQKKRKQVITKAAVSIGCLCIITALCINTALYIGTAANTPDTAYGNNEAFASSASGTDAAEAKSAKGQDIIIINNISGISSDRMKMNIMLGADDFVLMSREELMSYYGTGIFPSVPSDLKEWDIENTHGGYGIYRRSNGAETSEIYWDQNVINYSNKTFTRSINIEVHKGGMPFSDYGTLKADCDSSVINGEKVQIGMTGSGYYLVEFLHKNVGFRMIVEGLSQEELVSVIASLIDE